RVAAATLLLVAIVLLADSWAWIAAHFLTDAPLRTAIATGALAGIVCLSVWQTISLRKEYQSLIPLNLPGSTRIRTNRADVETYHWLVSSINSRCSSFYTMPGLFSIHLWTQKPPATTFNADAWMLVLTSDQQRRVIGDLSRAPGMCIVHSPELVKFWLRDHELGPSPLAEYAMTRFSVAAEKNGYILMTPKQ